MDDSTPVGNAISYLGDLTGIITAGAQAYGTVKNATSGNAAQNVPAQKTAVQTATSGNMLYYILGGVAVLILGAFLFLGRKGR
jgi:LPXTG-motif cell wall-anchored protein